MNRFSLQKQAQGFTIVELIVIIAVIVILATITFVSYNAVTEQSRAAAVGTDAQTVASALSKYKKDNGAYPDIDTFDSLEFGSLGSTVEYLYDTPSDRYCVNVERDGIIRHIESGNLNVQEGACE